ncbi:pantoate--beta-alanine ligase [Neorhizobium sp. NCHU2750]|uniref:pantoate--beta-alanine ligase n=1 Tax=Neorhizobium sp. NCHU2750 TaxID=1825976 RepID=UPI000E75C8DD|nr:pantoate-beta-alanine ligase [Neorhizobium sp. NCHU2750]
MQIISTITELRSAIAALRQPGQSVGFVPTMGYLHDGHLGLVSRSRAENAVTVVSIFVNPLQFSANEDLDTYPRNLDGDAALLRQAGVDILFAPGVKDMYPRPMRAVVDVPAIGRQLEGEVRPGHFAGVATVVSKLFNIVQPDNAYFGEKDYQQVIVIRQMVEDLAMPVTICPVATVRDHDGLALSSRNVYLDAAERRAAIILPRVLDEAERLVAEGITDPDEVEARARTLIATEPLADAEIVALRDAETLERISRITAPVVLALFVRIGTTRLLDNRVISPKQAALG